MPNLIGRSLGRYHILEQLGEGGMATVYKAYDTRLEHEVAVKVIRREAFPAEHHARIFKRFEREARALNKLSHPHIVKVVEYGEYDQSPFLVMEYLTGGTLKQKVGNPLPWVEAIQLILPIARALEYAHKQGIIHRDVKPSNVLITASGEPMLTDFGIAKLLESDEGQTLSTTTGVGVGTPEYMSPEQGLGQEVDARADIYSLGIVLYELVTGRKPFRADTPMAVIVKQINDPLPRPKQFAQDIPEAVEKALFKALAKKPEDRYSNMADFGKALDGLLETIRERERAIARRKAELARKEAETALKAEAKKKAQAERIQRRLEKAGQGRRLSWGLGGGIMLLVIMGIVFGAQKQSNLPLTTSSTSTVAVTLTPSPAAIVTRLPTQIHTPLPAPPYTDGAVLFESNFESAKMSDFDFSVWSKLANDDLRNPSQYWSIEQDQNGNHYLVGNAPDNKEISFQLGKPNWGNYVIEAKFNAQRLPSNGQGGAAVRIRTGGSGLNNCPNGYEFAFGEWLSIYNDCTGEHLVTAPHGKIEEDKWYSFKIESFNNEFQEYVDGELIHRLLDDTSLNGSISIGTGLGGKVYYDDIRVIELVPVEGVLSAESAPSPGEITDEKGVVMQFVPAGEFNMGSEAGEADEQPVHTVYLDAYYMDKYEVTNAFYAACENAGVCTPPWSRKSRTRSSYYGDSQFTDFPVITVDWNQANAYCVWRGARLPTEAEWEKAASGTDSRTYPWGEGINCDKANYGDCGSDTTKAGSNENGKSPYGIYDMTGNVTEWVADWYDAGFYVISPSSNPTGPSSGDYRVLHGGSWDNVRDGLRVSDRLKYSPNLNSYGIGFRCARSANQ